MSLQGYHVQQGYDELIRAHQAMIRRVITEVHLARQVRPSRPVDWVSPLVAGLTAPGEHTSPRA